MLYLPAFPIARWLVENWWTLLNEPLPAADIPKPFPAHFPWIRRHCLRASDSGALLPALYFFNDGRGVGIDWRGDEPGLFLHMPGEFSGSGAYHLDKDATEVVLAGFVSEILIRVDGVKDKRVQDLQEAWRTIQTADSEERAFSVTAGRMGVDPYDPDQLGEDLAALIEREFNDPEHPLIRDLTESAHPDSVAGQWAWVQFAKDKWKLGPNNGNSPVWDASAHSPFMQGYRLARDVRDRAGLPPGDAVPDVESVAQHAADVPFLFPEENHVPGIGLRALVGWNDKHQIVVAGPRHPRKDSQRFLAARGLCHALLGCGVSPRLITESYTWDQQVSRAFAAEFLAPQAALASRTGERADRSQVEILAGEFAVSALVVRNQLENAGVAVIDE